MILQSLDALYRRLVQDESYGIAPSGYSQQAVSLCVVISLQGALVQFSAVETEEVVQRGKKTFVFKRPRKLILPGLGTKSGSGLNANFLSGSARYVLGFKNEDDDSDRTRECYEEFKCIHLAAAEEIGCEEFSAVCAFLRAWTPASATAHPDLAALATHRCVFSIQGRTHFVHETSAFETWWGTRGSNQTAIVEGQCLVTGQIGPIAKLHEPKIKGFESTGTLLVSFNDDAYTSYRPEHKEAQALTAPVSQDVVFRYTTALNALLDGPQSRKHSIKIGDSKTVFWTESRTGAESIFSEFLQGHTPDESVVVQDESLRRSLETFFSILRSGGGRSMSVSPDETSVRFFILSLTGQAKGRLGVRAWHETTVGDLTYKLSRHFSALACVRPSERYPEFPTFQDLLDQTANLKDGKTDRDRIPPNLAGALLRSVLREADYPLSLVQAVINRIRADRFIDPAAKLEKPSETADARRRAYLRAAILKAFLNRNHHHGIPMSLDSARLEPAYRLGRLFAALEKTQEDALPGINATIRDRFYSAASATPATVFPRLLRTYQHHLTKAAAERGVGLKINRERLVQEICSGLAAMPVHLGLEGQSLFALGYYHQRQAFFAKPDAEVQPAA
jgi:CRISPR-associated protein Csd1